MREENCLPDDPQVKLHVRAGGKRGTGGTTPSPIVCGKRGVGQFEVGIPYHDLTIGVAFCFPWNVRVKSNPTHSALLPQVLVESKAKHVSSKHLFITACPPKFETFRRVCLWISKWHIHCAFCSIKCPATCTVVQTLLFCSKRWGFPINTESNIFPIL